MDDFLKATKALKDHFKQTKKSDPYLQNCFDDGRQIDKLLRDVQLSPGTITQRAKVREELDTLAAALTCPPTKRIAA